MQAKQEPQESGPYDWTNGGGIKDSWKDRILPVPPKWVGEYTVLPNETGFATLSSAVADWYPAEARAVCIQYVKDWPTVRKYGHHLLVVGGRSSWRIRQIAAAATVNEIVLRYASMFDVSQQYIKPHILRTVLPFKSTRFDSYAAFRSKILGAKLLLVEDPHLAAESADERYFFSDLYEIRDERRLPTITTFSNATDEDYLKTVRNALGFKAADILEHSGKYVARF